MTKYTEESYKETVKAIYALADSKYKSFHSGLVPGADNIIGVTVPKLRCLAKETAKGDYKGYLSVAAYTTYEETMLKGMVIANCKCTVKERLQYTKEFVPHINNWAVCDVFCAALKEAKKEQSIYRSFIDTYLKSNKEFYLRFAIVMLMDYFINDDYIDNTLKVLEGVHHDGYYVKMAAAWALSVCFVKYRDKTLKLLESNKIDDVTFNKTLQKCRESRRVSSSDKEMLNKMKRSVKQ